MKQLRIPLLIVIVAVISSMITVSVQAGLNSFRTSIETALGTDFNNGNRNEIGAAFAEQYSAEWNAAVAAGTYNDNNNGRTKFASKKIVDYVQAIRTASLRKTSLGAVPTPTPLPDN